jgi:hypothetical protein
MAIKTDQNAMFFPSEGNCMGDWASQISKAETIIRGVWVNAKTYGLEIDGPTGLRYEVKSKGFTVPKTSRDEFEDLRQLLIGNKTKIVKKQFSIRTTKHFQLYNLENEKSLRITDAKRFSLDG